MKRHPALQDLSRDHHPALLHARRLRCEDPRVDAATARRRFLQFSEKVLRFHYDEEDLALVPFIRDLGQRERLRTEHADLRERVALLATADEGFQRDLGERLRAHIRFEEDDLFETMQRDLTKEEWVRLAAVARAFRAKVRPGSIGPKGHEECFV
jgi:hemerythrin-like domain-containing protein